MTIVNKREPIILLLGDIIVLGISLWFTLLIRYWSLPSVPVLLDHLRPFLILFLVWVVTFFIAGLYELHTSMMKRSLPSVLIKTQILNSVIAVLFFYFIPYFGITPKTNLFIYLIASLGILILWRLVVYQFFAPRQKYNALLIGRGSEMQELRDEINSSKYGYKISSSVNLDNIESLDVQEDIINRVFGENISIVIIDTQDDSVIPLLPRFYNLMFSNITFLDMHEVYEQIFGRVPISLVKHGWFLENVRSKPHEMYDALKRVMDIILALFLGILSIVFYPIVAIGTFFDKTGPLFYKDIRIGKNNHPIEIIKFRSMRKDGGDNDDIGAFGRFIRNTRIDELPQLWNVIRGDLSLIGPRPEQPKLVDLYKERVPYYNIRHLIKPGLSGWAQMKHDQHPHHGADVEETKNKLSYDLYYIKNRSLILDFKIALQTIRTLISKQGK